MRAVAVVHQEGDGPEEDGAVGDDSVRCGRPMRCSVMHEGMWDMAQEEVGKWREKPLSILFSSLPSVPLVMVVRIRKEPSGLSGKPRMWC